MNELQIGCYFVAGILAIAFCSLLKNEKSIRLMQNFVIAMLGLAIGYTIFSLIYFVSMKQLVPCLTRVFTLSLHKIVIFFVDGMIIACILARPVFYNKQPHLLIAESRLLYNLLRYFMAAYFLCSGVSKTIGFSAILGFFQLSGYSVLFLYFIILLEISLGIALLFKRTATIAALMLIVEMAGATYTHYHNYFEHQVPEPFSNSLDSLKMLPFLLVIALIYNPNTSKSIT